MDGITGVISSFLSFLFSINYSTVLVLFLVNFISCIERVGHGVNHLLITTIIIGTELTGY